MDFVINDNELSALCGLPHTQQLAYLRGIRPYMDVKTGIVGIKRGISYQSLAEQLYVEPHQGIKSESYSRPQLRRALAGLERAGLIQLQSQGLKLILKCELATLGYFNQNKAVTNPAQQEVTAEHVRTLTFTGFNTNNNQNPDIAKTAKADTPLKDNNYIYLLSEFEKFWMLYPEKKSRSNALNAFININPNPSLCDNILQALQAQINNRHLKQLQGQWLPPWKFPSNWLTQKCWEDEITMDLVQQESKHEKHTRNKSGTNTTTDMFWIPEETDDAPTTTNVIQFQRYSEG